MTLAQAKTLIKCDPLISARQPQTWFDLGCGSGLFSEALHELLPEGSLIYAIDKKATIFYSKGIAFVQLDFVKDPLPNVPVDGILMANSLHYVKDKLRLITRIKNNLKANSIFLLVEYDIETSNQWVPYPISFPLAKDLFSKAGFNAVSKLTEMPSVLNSRNIYSAIFFDKDKIE